MTRKGKKQTCWTEAKRAVVRNLYPEQVDVFEIGKRIGKTPSQVREQARQMGLRRTAKVNWTDDELATLCADYEAGLHPAKIAEKLDRPLAGIYTQAHLRGLKMPHRRDWTPEEDSIIRDGHAAGLSLLEVAAKIDRKYCTVAKRSSKALGLDFAKGPRKKQPKPAAPAPAETVADPESSCGEQQSARKKAVRTAARRIDCLRIAAKFKKSTLGIIGLAEEIDRWAGRTDRGFRLDALGIAAARHGDVENVWKEAQDFIEWAGISGATPHRVLPEALNRLLADVAEATGVAVQVLCGDSRVASIVRARHLFCYAAYHLAGASYSEIGRRLGGRDHSTIRHAVLLIDAERGPRETEEILATVSEAFGLALPPPPERAETEPTQETVVDDGARSMAARETEPAQKPAPAAKLNPKPAPKRKADPKPAAKRPVKVRRKRRRAAPARPAEPATLSDAEDRVLRAIIRTGAGSTDRLAEITGIPVGPVTKVADGLRRKGYIQSGGGKTRALRVPSGTPVAPIGDMSVRIVNPITIPRAPARPADPTPAPKVGIQHRALTDGPERRRCLGCGGMFNSSGPGNRQCSTCKSHMNIGDDWMSGGTV